MAISPKKTFVRKKHVTSAPMNDFVGPKVAAFLTAVSSSSNMEPREPTSTNLRNNKPSAPSWPPVIAQKAALSVVDRKIVLGAVVRIAGYFLSHPEMAQIGDSVLKMAECGMVQDAKKVIGLLEDRLADNEVRNGDVAVVEGGRTEVLQAMVANARYLLRYPKIWKDNTAEVETEAEKTMVDMVIKVVGFLDGHPAAGRLAVSDEVSEFVKRKRGELEMGERTSMDG